MTDCPSHGGMLPIRDAILCGGLLHNPGERTVVGVANKWAENGGRCDGEPANEPAHDRVFRRVIGCGGKNVINAVVKLAAIRREVGAVNGVGCLEYQRQRSTDDEMDQHEGPKDQKQRLAQDQHRQNQHVGEVESLSRKKDAIFLR